MKIEEEIVEYAKKLDKKIEKMHNSISYMKKENFSTGMIEAVEKDCKRYSIQLETLIWVLDY